MKKLIIRDLFAWIFYICVVRGHGILKRSDERGIAATYLVISIVIAVSLAGTVAYISTRPKAKFQIEDFSLSSTKVAQGESVTVQVKVSNTGDAEGTHTVEVEVGDEILTKDMILDAGESRTVSFAIDKLENGTYDIDVEGLSKTFEVVKPAEFEVSNLSLTPSKVEQGESEDMSVDVNNVGGLSGEYTVDLKIDGTIEDTKTVPLDGGESTTVTFTVKREKKKSYSVEIGNLSDSFEVVAPAEFEVSDLTISPEEPVVGDLVTISANVTNVGKIEGTYEATLEIDGESKNQEITIAPNEAQTVDFETEATSGGTYNVNLNGLSDNFFVSEFEIVEVGTTDYIDPETNQENPPETVFAKGDTIYYYAIWRQYTDSFKYWDSFSLSRPGTDPSQGEQLTEGSGTIDFTEAITWNSIPTYQYTETGEYLLRFTLAQFDEKTGEQIGVRVENTTFEVREGL